MKKVGIIGFGSFGKFLAENLDPYCAVKVFSKSGQQNRWAASLAEAAAADFVVLAIPLEAYEAMLAELKPVLGPASVLVDVCSVKAQPAATIKRLMPDQPFAATHPLFGPESAAKSLEGHTLVLCPDVSDAAALTEIENFGNSIGLLVEKLDTVEHDREMALVQGLTFFIARVLSQFGLDDQKLSTPSFKRLLYLKQLEEHHSQDLFYTIQTGNAQTAAVREKFLKLAENLHQDINRRPS